ncbi:DUF3558 domain-containing protein [Amycolatopsis saalfeldensis]|uniref:DUF3558 domain-containing protein n=1 Tax=Amycolatopsis saalfeldensis TaxID=394193 RepID=A0A1H8Y5B9_9PSEU|nr:DUF3558 domain-containing protein [Amycolatopsis saalfeldensis]SEP47272.1 Protein of unknown function [Amycolatopsis saalfeldensis]
MTSTKLLAALCTAILATAALTACDPKEPAPVLDQPPTPVQPGPILPFTPVKQPLDLTPFESAPCQILTKDQVAAVVDDPPDGVRPTASKDPATFRCTWVTTHGLLVTISEPQVKPVNLTELAATRASRARGLEPWSEISLDGYPAAIFHETPGPDDCDVAVGVNDTKMLHFSYGGEGSPSRYWDKNRCGGVLKTAEFVLDNLRHT